jgi:threonine/homoserine/homoserine lactone efflux protein
MPMGADALGLLSAMITPAVLISACGTLIFSTAARLARVVDRVRTLSRQLEQLYASDEGPFSVERRHEVERQLFLQARRGRLIQRSLTALYVSLGFFVATTVSIGLASLLPRVPWIPAALGIAGTLVLFYGCMVFIGETRLALRSVDLEMEFVLRMRGMYQSRHGQPPPAAPQD